MTDLSANGKSRVRVIGSKAHTPHRGALPRFRSNTDLTGFGLNGGRKVREDQFAANRLSPFGGILFIVFHVLLGVAVLAAGRLAAFHAFADPDALAGRDGEILEMWRIGLLYDLRVVAIGLLPLALLCMAACCCGRAASVLRAVQKYYSPVAYCILVLAACTGFYYYQTFHTRIDAFVFGLVNDDTRAVMTSILHDYPLPGIAALVAGTTFSCAWLTRRACLAARKRRFPSAGVVLSAAALAVFALAYAVACRGSVGVFPLRQNDSRVSELPLLNHLTPNSLMAFSWACKEYRDSIVYEPVPEALGRELAMKATGRDTLWDATGENAFLAKNPPHVVMVMMESFGFNFLRFDRPDSVDLLGSLRRHTEEDFYFRRFTSEENGTMPSLAALALSCPDQTITQGTNQRIRLDGTVFETYKANGYETAFISPGKGSWCNIAPYLLAQGSVDHVFDQNSLIAEDPSIAPQADTWGLPDEHAFRFAERLLSESDKPLFIFILTVTNHSPYEPPAHYSPHALNPDAETLANINARDDMKIKMFETFQYASNCLGDFISSIKNGDLGRRTVIAATGDHHMRSIKSHAPEDSFLDAAVPFYLYLPGPVRERTSHYFDPARPGSHKDIMPTLYAHSLSNARYYSVGGRDMLKENDDPERAFGYNVDLMFDSRGAGFVGAVSSNGFLFSGTTRLSPANHPPSPRFMEKMRAFGELRRWQINARVAGLRE